MLGEERVVMEAVAVAGGDSEGKCLQPCGATLGVCGEDDIVVARLEDALEEHDSFGSLFPYPIVLVEHQAFF
jgi:hypothetical protein